MIKIFLTVRNRLAITKKCIEALKKHSTIRHQLYVYNNQTNHLLEEHFKYFYKLYSRGLVAQVSFTSDDSNFNAFSKASTCNFFGSQHEHDPNKDKYNFLVFMDNDIIVTPGWDKKLHRAWTFVVNQKMNNIKVIGQLPGGIKNKGNPIDLPDDMKGRPGKLGGSGLWSVRPNFFRDVGYLNLKELVGHNKKHDQLYWRSLERASGRNPYILGLDQKLGIHCGSQAGSVCNTLTRGGPKLKGKLDKIKFERAEKEIDSVEFDLFFKRIYNDKRMLNDW
jgi:hypothetical protein